MEIDIIVDKELKLKLDEDWLRSVARATLEFERIGPEVEMGLVITTQERVHELNRQYRKLDEPTDVLSFYMEPQAGELMNEAPWIAPPGSVRHLGEVIISYPQALKQAEEQGQPVRRELALLIVHGVLHLLGYNDEDEEHADLMRAKQEGILAGIQA